MTTPFTRPDVRAFLDAINGSPLAAMETLGHERARLLTRQMREARPPVAHALAIVRDLECAGKGGPIPLRFYDKRAARDAGPVVAYLHGGGFVLGDLDSHHQVCVDIAEQVDVPVVSIDYRLAPEHPFPAAVDDAEAATRWIAGESAGVLDRSFDALVLAGDSAGANLAAVTARTFASSPAKLPVAAQFLIYPTGGSGRPTASQAAFAEGHFLTRAAMDWFEASYAAPRGDPRYDLFAGDLAAMPPTLLVTAGLDPLRDEGRAYAAALIEAGVSVTYQEARGNLHGFFGAASVIPSSAEDVRDALGALRQMIRRD